MDQITLTQNETAAKSKSYFEVVPGLWGMKTVFVNLYMVTTDEGWVLIDAGLHGHTDAIVCMAEDLYGTGTRPTAIILTHGHFDHVGNLEELLEKWDVPVYAHRLEMPFLTGKASYPPADPTVGGGLMPLMGFMFPTNPKNLGSSVHALTHEREVPHMPGWEFLHTPGHAPGHISLFRPSDKVLIAGDAFVATQQESVFSVLTQQEELCGPPKYFTIDWQKAEESVQKLAVLQPEIAATGHGKPLYGARLQDELQYLADNFVTEWVPAQGRYAKDPARTDENGVQYVPPANTLQIITTAAAAVVTVVVVVGVAAKLFGRSAKA